MEALGCVGQLTQNVAQIMFGHWIASLRKFQVCNSAMNNTKKRVGQALVQAGNQSMFPVALDMYGLALKFICLPLYRYLAQVN